jgi:hypothetical protein
MNDAIPEAMSRKDRINVTQEIDKEGNKSLSYRKSWEKNGLNHSIEVKKVEGGYIISESKYGTPKDQGEDAEYIDERSERVSTINPFKDDKEDKLDKDEKMFGFVDKPNF